MAGATEVNMVITSCIDGRIRVRDGLLQSSAVAGSLSRLLLGTPGVEKVTANPRAGSLLILYHSAKTTLAEITALLERLLPREKSAASALKGKDATGRKGKSSAMKRQIVNFGMLAALIISLAGAILDAKALHIVAGLVFLGLFGFHFFDKKHFLFSFGGR